MSSLNLGFDFFCKGCSCFTFQHHLDILLVLWSADQPPDLCGQAYPHGLRTVPGAVEWSGIEGRLAAPGSESWLFSLAVWVGVMLSLPLPQFP